MFKRKTIGAGSGCPRRCFPTLAESLILQKYLDLRRPLFHTSHNGWVLGAGSRLEFFSKQGSEVHVRCGGGEYAVPILRPI